MAKEAAAAEAAAAVAVAAAARRRAVIVAGHVRGVAAADDAADAAIAPTSTKLVAPFACIQYTDPELNSGNTGGFDTVLMRGWLDGHDVETRDAVCGLMLGSRLFCASSRGEVKDVQGRRRVFMSPDYDAPMAEQREMTMRRIGFLQQQGLFRGWLTDDAPAAALRMAAMFETVGTFDHSLAIKLGVHFHLWGGAIRYLGTARHHRKWLKATEEYEVKGCFAMTELGHGSNVRGIETVAVYDAEHEEFVISTPCESAQKYWIGGAAQHATHAIVFAQLLIKGANEGVHAFITQLRDDQGRLCCGVRVADCGHKIGLNGVDNGRIWFDAVRVPRDNLLNSVADVTPDGRYVSAIQDADQRFGTFLAPLTSGRVTIAVSALYQAKVGLATAIRYALSRRAFALSADSPELLLLDYPSHQRRLLPLVAKTYAFGFAALQLKSIYVKRKPADAKLLHVLSSGYKAVFTWHNMNTLQECREACGGQGLKTENRVGQLKAEYDVQLTFEGDNKVLMQQVSKALLAGFITSKKEGHGTGLESEPAWKAFRKAGMDLRDAHFQVALFRLRERDLLVKLASRVRTAHGISPVLLLQNYRLAEDLARAFVERSVLETFVAQEEGVAAAAAGLNHKSSAGASSAKEALTLLRSLFVLVAIDEDAVFLRHGYVSAQQACQVEAEVSKLCMELRPYSLALVDAFGIHPALLGPIAFDWIAANQYL